MILANKIRWKYSIIYFIKKQSLRTRRVCVCCLDIDMDFSPDVLLKCFLFRFRYAWWWQKGTWFVLWCYLFLQFNFINIICFFLFFLLKTISNLKFGDFLTTTFVLLFFLFVSLKRLSNSYFHLFDFNFIVYFSIILFFFI